MNRRDFLSAAGAATLTAWLPASAHAAAAGRYENLLILIELKGGNDGGEGRDARGAAKLCVVEELHRRHVKRK